METGLIGIGKQYPCFQPDNPIVIYCKYTTVIWGGGGGLFWSPGINWLGNVGKDRGMLQYSNM